MNTNQADKALRKCPHCNGCLSRYEDPRAVELLRSAEQKNAGLRDALRFLSGALHSFDGHGGHTPGCVPCIAGIALAPGGTAPQIVESGMEAKATTPLSPRRESRLPESLLGSDSGEDAQANAVPDSTLSAERLAKKFHESYERLAPEFGYKTRIESAVTWDDVPIKNKQLMSAVCAEILGMVSK